MSKNSGLWSYMKTGLKLVVLSIASAIIYYMVMWLFALMFLAFLPKGLSIILFLIVFGLVSLLVTGFLAQKMWKWK